MMDPASPQPTDAPAVLRALLQAALQTEPPIDAAEAASLMRCTPDQVEEMARAGELPATKIGRSWIFVRATLLEHLARRSIEEMEERRAKRQPDAQAVKLGAVEITWRQSLDIVRRRREAATKAATTSGRRCACPADDSMECAAIRYGMDHCGEGCECSCHARRDDDDDDY